MQEQANGRRSPAGALHIFESINHFFLIGQPLGLNMARLLKKINA